MDPFLRPVSALYGTSTYISSVSIEDPAGCCYFHGKKKWVPQVWFPILLLSWDSVIMTVSAYSTYYAYRPRVFVSKFFFQTWVYGVIRYSLLYSRIARKNIIFLLCSGLFIFHSNLLQAGFIFLLSLFLRRGRKNKQKEMNTQSRQTHTRTLSDTCVCVCVHINQEPERQTCCCRTAVAILAICSSHIYYYYIHVPSCPLDAVLLLVRSFEEASRNLGMKMKHFLIKWDLPSLWRKKKETGGN